MSERGDLEIVLACAQASEIWKEAHKWYPTMTLDPTFSGAEIRGNYCYLIPNNPMRQGPQVYDPLTDDAEAMALLHFLISKNRNVHIWTHAFSTFDGCRSDGVIENMTDPAQLRRAICLCVAHLSRAG